MHVFKAGQCLRNLLLAEKSTFLEDMNKFVDRLVQNLQFNCFVQMFSSQAQSPFCLRVGNLGKPPEQY